LLAFIISLLTDKGLSKYIQNEKVKEVVQSITRDFVVVHWELQPNDVDLSAYFYDNIELQLEEKYSIKLELNLDGIVDHKKMVLKILDIIKKDDSQRGLVVVIDEISDFLKQKSKEKIQRDVQFLRVLGQVANNSDFMLIGAMQEQIFSNPKYVDEAESFGRVSERFQIITIHREDIKRVIARRVLSKTTKQRMELENLLGQYTKYFPNIQLRMEEYIDLFPLHPYVVQIFSELPYFEKRGIIQFTMMEVEKILDREFPCFITYDRIYDEIAGRHTVKNLDIVSPVVDAVKTLESKIDLVDSRHQNTARQLVKALAVLKLYGKSTQNGATAEELANTLLLIPQNKMMEATDEITLVMNHLRKVSDGQFINKTEDGYYFIDLSLDVDYDQVIDRKADNLPENAMDDEIRKILQDQLLLDENTETGGYADTCPWKERHSFRNGIFIYENGKGDVIPQKGDYQIVFVSPLCSVSRYRPSENSIIVKGSLSDEALQKLRRLAAARILINDNVSRSKIEQKYTDIRKSFIGDFLKCYLESGYVEIGSEKKSIKQIISREFQNFDELFSQIKPLLTDYFKQKYPRHPVFTHDIARDNIRGEFSGALKDLISRGSTLTLFSNAKSILKAMDLIDENGNLSTARSEVAKKILERARAEKGKNIDVQEIIKEIEGSPYGYHPEMTEFIMIILAYNGEISLKAAGGKIITSSEVEEVFGSGIDAFENIRYIAIESDFDISPVIELFNILGLNTANLRGSSKRVQAVQDFRENYLTLKEKTESVQQRLVTISIHDSNIIDIDGLKEKHKDMMELPLEDFGKVKTPLDFKKVVYPIEKLSGIKQSLKRLDELDAFYNNYYEKIKKAAEYAMEVKNILDKYPGIFQIEGIKELLDVAFHVLKNTELLLDKSQQYTLLGKLEQIQKKYMVSYYNAHEKVVGSKVDWTRLSTLSGSTVFRNMKLLKNVSLLNKGAFSKVENDIMSLQAMKCLDFNVDILKEKVTCPRCNFPLGFEEKDLDKQIDQIEDEIHRIYGEWENTILVELEHYRDNIEYLTSSEKAILLDVIKNGRLPEVISEDLIKALNNVFSELEIISLKPQELASTIFSDSQVIDYYTLERRLNEYKHKLVAGKDLSKVRFIFSEEER
jgi:hypothetical protein